MIIYEYSLNESPPIENPTIPIDVRDSVRRVFKTDIKSRLDPDEMRKRRKRELLAKIISTRTIYSDYDDKDLSGDDFDKRPFNPRLAKHAFRSDPTYIIKLNRRTY